MSEATEKKAAKYLSDGKIKVKQVMGDFGEFLAYGSGDEPYTVRYVGQVWSCSCPAHKIRCAHVIACMVITDMTSTGHVRLGDDEDLDALLSTPSTKPSEEDWAALSE